MNNLTEQKGKTKFACSGHICFGLLFSEDRLVGVTDRNGMWFKALSLYG